MPKKNVIEKIPSYSDLSEARAELRALMKSLYDFQELRKGQANRLKLKADGSEQKDNGTNTQMAPKGISDLESCWNEVSNVENYFLKALEKRIKLFPEWNGFLKGVKGCGPLMAAVLISEINIEKASTVSKIWQYAGLNPSMVFGKKKDKDKTVVTTELVRGDRPTSGYILPYNKFLKTKLLGVLATCFIKAQSPYTEFYYNYKNRLENSDRVINGDSKGYKWNTPAEIPALDENGNVKYKTKKNPKTGEVEQEVVMRATGMGMHRDKASKRYMIKMFLRDYYNNVRTMYGFDVRCPYEEEYLGRKHHAE